MKFEKNHWSRKILINRRFTLTAARVSRSRIVWFAFSQSEIFFLQWSIERRGPWETVENAENEGVCIFTKFRAVNSIRRPEKLHPAEGLIAKPVDGWAWKLFVVLNIATIFEFANILQWSSTVGTFSGQAIGNAICSRCVYDSRKVRWGFILGAFPRSYTVRWRNLKSL